MESIYLIAHVLIIVLILVNAVMTTMTTALSKFFSCFLFIGHFTWYDAGPLLYVVLFRTSETSHARFLDWMC